MSGVWRLSGLGMELAGSIIGLGLIGWLIDRWQGSAPTGALIGAGVGIIGGGYNFIRKALSLNKEEARKYKAAHPTGPARKATPGTATGASESMFNRTAGEITEEDDDDTLTKLWSDMEPPGADSPGTDPDGDDDWNDQPPASTRQ